MRGKFSTAHRINLTIENEIQLLKIKESNSKETNEVGKIFYNIHNKYFSEKTVRMDWPVPEKHLIIGCSSGIKIQRLKMERERLNKSGC